MIAVCPECGAKNRLPASDSQKRYRCYKCKASLEGLPEDSGDSRGIAADSSTQPKRKGVKLLSISFVLLVLVIAGLIGGVVWVTADKISASSRERLRVIMYPDERLRQIAEPVHNVQLERGQITELFELMRNTAMRMDAVGIAATQVGVPKRIIMVRTSTGVSLADSEYLGMVNPEITERDGSSTTIDGCLSLPKGDWKTEVTRSETVTVDYLTSDGLEQTLRASGTLAREIQHEIDHLDGILVIDYAKPHHFNCKLVSAAGIYLVVLVAAVVWYVTNRIGSRRRTS